MVEAMGGRIRLADSSPKGTRFTVSLPASVTAKQPATLSTDEAVAEAVR
jgi:signal transduction histidine kinase